MKLILEETFAVENVIELNESSGEKNYVIKGTFSTPDKKNRNGRIYASKLWEDNVAKYQNELKGSTTNTLMEKEHPPRTSVDPWSAVAQIRKLEMREGVVYGEAVLLNIPETAVMRELIEKGIKIGVSSRGVGKMKGDIVEEFNLITYDIVSTPSDYNANLEGFNESMILEGVEIEVNEKGQYICTPEGCSLAESKHKEDSEETDDLKSDEKGTKDADEKNKDVTEQEHDGDCECDTCKQKRKQKMKDPQEQSECDKKAKKLAEAFEAYAKGGALTEDEIKFQELKEKFDTYMGVDESDETMDDTLEEGYSKDELIDALMNGKKKIKTGFGDKTAEGLTNMIMNNDDIVDELMNGKKKINTGFGAKTAEGIKSMVSQVKALKEDVVDEAIKVNTQAICDQAKKLSPANQAKVFAFVLSLQD